MKLISIKAYTRPSPGDTYFHQRFGNVRLMRKWRGDTFICEAHSGKRIILSPKLMQRVHNE